MTSNADDLVRRYASVAAGQGPSDGKPLPPDSAQVWDGIHTTAGKLGSVRVRDSARRRWNVEVHREPERGRYLVVSPVHGDNEPFRASADGYRLDTHLRITPEEWTLLALLSYGRGGDEGRDDEELRHEVFRLVDRMVIEAQHRALMGAAEEEEDDE